jgi:proteic killer suppression protein
LDTALDILFASKKLERLCHDDKLATRALGHLSAQKLRHRLDDLIAAANLGYARKLPGRFHGLAGESSGQFALDMQGGHRLVVEPAHTPVPTLNDGSLDLSKVTKITVVYIGDYHD